MTVTETLGGLGSWELRLSEGTPDAILDQLGFYGHIAIVPGPVDVEAAGDGLLSGARYVGVLRAKGKGGERRIAGSGMLLWLGDEDNKGHVIETEIPLTAATFTQAVTALLPPTVTLGTIHPGATGTYTGKHVFQSPRQALTTVCDAFGRELRVNGDATVDFGTQAQLYTATPDSILVRKGAGADLDLVALAGQFDVDSNVYDKSTRVLLLGQTIGVGDEPSETFATGAADAPVVTDVDLRGNPVKFTRMISESGETAGSVAARAQLQLNRFNRTARSVQLRLADYETEGNFRVGDMTYVYDPETDIFDPAREVDFRGELLHPDIVRVSGMTWPVARGMTVAYRTQAGVWLDLAPFVTWETGGTELTIGDLPKSLNRPGDDPIQVRIDAHRGQTGPDTSIPKAPTGLTLTTDATINPQGQTVAVIEASWTDVTLNTDDSVITDLSHYLVAFRPAFRAPLWEPSRIATTNSIDLTGLVVDLDYDVRVAAVDTANHISAWSTTATIRAAKDDIAPPAPADPVATNVMGQARIEYIGTTSTGAQMPSDTNRIDVHIGTTAGFTATAATRVSSLDPFAKGVHYATVPYGAAARWVRLVAVDRTGNPSGPSASVPLTASQVVNPDIFAGAVGTLQLADLAVTSAKIGLLQVNDAHIGNLNVGKLVSGVGTFELLLAGRITTAYTGQRTSMTPLGFQGWNAAEALTINLDGINNLLTGRLRTAITGRRLDMGAAGKLGEIEFIAPDGKTGFVRAYTESAGVEAIQFGMEVPSTNSLWNRINYNSDEWANYRAKNQDFYFSTAGGFFAVRETDDKGVTASTRLQIDGTAIAYYDTTAQQRLLIGPTALTLYTPESGDVTFWARKTDGTAYVREWINPTAHQIYVPNGGSFNVSERSAAGGTDGRLQVTASDVWFRWPGAEARVLVRPSNRADTSARIQLVHPNNFGTTILYRATSSGSSSRLEFMDAVESGYVELWAAGFTVSSSREVKEGITDFGKTGGLDLVRSLNVKSFRRKGMTDMDGHTAPAGRTEIGLIAEETPDELRVNDGDTPMVDLMSTLGAVIAGVQKLADDVDELRRGQAA